MFSGRKLSVWVFGDEGDIIEDKATQSLILASSIIVTGTMLVSPLVNDLAPVFSVDDVTAGYLIVSFTLTTALALPFVGPLGDRIGRKPVLCVGLLLFGVSGAAVGSIPSFELALTLRGIQGIGYAMTMPIILTLFGDLYSGSREATVQGMRITANSLVNAAVPLFAGILFVYSWRYPFFLYLLAIPSAIWVWVAVPRIDAMNDWSILKYIKEMRQFLTSITMGLLMFSFMFRFFVFYGVITYFSVLAIQEAGIAIVAVGALLTVQNLMKTIGSTQVGRLSMRFSSEFLSFIAFALVAFGTLIMGAFPVAATLITGVVIWGLGDGLLAPAQKSLVNQLSPSEYRSGSMSTALVFQNVGKVTGPVFMALLLGVLGPGVSFVILALVAGGLGVICLGGVWAINR